MKLVGEEARALAARLREAGLKDEAAKVEAMASKLSEARELELKKEADLREAEVLAKQLEAEKEAQEAEDDAEAAAKRLREAGLVKDAERAEGLGEAMDDAKTGKDMERVAKDAHAAADDLRRRGLRKEADELEKMAQSTEEAAKAGLEKEAAEAEQAARRDLAEADKMGHAAQDGCRLYVVAARSSSWRRAAGGT